MIETIKQLLDWIYRRNCYFCHKPSSLGLMCQKCYEKIEINFPQPIKIINNIEIYSASLYMDNLKKLIRGLKYHKKQEFAVYFAKMLYSFWQKLDIEKENFEIIPIPLYPKKEKQRKYNHMILVAKEFSKLTGYPVNFKIAKRIKDTKPQYKLKWSERVENLKDAFQINPEEYNGKKLLLMDDICTTGATLKELIKTFQKHNITDLYAIVGASPTNTTET